MNAGLLRHQVILEELTDTSDDQGGSAMRTWSAFTAGGLVQGGKVWASIDQLDGSESYDAFHFAPTATHRIRIRYVPNLTPKNRIRFGTRIFEIVSSIRKEEHFPSLEIMAEEKLTS